MLILLKRYGIKIDNKNAFTAEEIVKYITKNPKFYEWVYTNSKAVNKEKLQTELPRFILLNTFDRKGKILERVAQRSRK